ncbi:MAG: glycosyltransferase family 4 protein [Butyrivibrio sp.]|nr:glycosyltransferase family 4 protein [Butyrivibrio sp.]
MDNNNNKTKKLHIAMLGHKSIPSRKGGIEVVLTILCPMLVDRGFKVTCLNRAVNNTVVVEEHVIRNGWYKGVEVRELRTIDRQGWAAVTSSITGAIKAALSNYDIVHFHAEGPCMMLWLPKLFGKKCIATVHGLDWKRDKWKNGLGSLYIYLGERVMVKRADEIIVLSHSAQEYFMEEYGRKTILIPNGVEPATIRKPNLITQKFGLKGEDYFCSVSRLVEEKGIHDLIKAYNLIKTDKKLLIVGDDMDKTDYIKSIKDLAKDNPNIIFAGFQSGEILEEIYSNAYAYVIPSNLEGMSIGLLEAMAYGNAIVASDIPEIQEVACNDALYFKCGDYKDLADRLQMLNDNSQVAENLKTDVVRHVNEMYSWDKVADKIANLYEQLV